MTAVELVENEKSVAWTLQSFGTCGRMYVCILLGSGVFPFLEHNEFGIDFWHLRMRGCHGRFRIWLLGITATHNVLNC